MAVNRGKNGKVLTREEIREMAQINKEKNELEKARQELEKTQIALEKEERSKTVSRRPPTFSQEHVLATKGQICDTINEKIKWLKFNKELGPVKTDEDLENRIYEFWDMCAKTGEIPQKEDFHMFLGVSATTVRRWMDGQGCSRTRYEMLQAFNSMYNSVRDSLAAKGLINEIANIWQSKQWQGYKEPKQEIDVTTNNPMLNFPDADAIASKYSDLLMDETEVDTKYLKGVEVEE